MEESSTVLIAIYSAVEYFTELGIKINPHPEQYELYVATKDGQRNGYLPPFAKE
jgi:hypothetical protein